MTPVQPSRVPLDRDKIRTLRERAGLTLAEAARRAGMKSYQHWQSVESGPRPNVTIDTLDRMAVVLGVSAAELLRPSSGG